MNKWWGLFWLLGIIWGSSFMLIRIGVKELNPYEMVFIRTAIAAVGMHVVMFARGKRYSFRWATLRPLVLIGLGNTMIPFILITWGEQSVESGLAAVLQSTAVLFSIVISHFAFDDERITPQKIAGLLMGFVGIILLAGRNWEGGTLDMLALFGMLAIVLASLFYASFTVYSKTVIRSRFDPIVVSAGAMGASAIGAGIVTYLSPLVGGPAPSLLSEVSQGAVASVITLGVLNTFVAYLIFYELVQQLGASKTAMVTYVVPPVGLLLGVVFLNEPLDIYIILGAGLIFAAIAVVNVRRRHLSRLRPAGAAGS